jgi:hypothetical protein
MAWPATFESEFPLPSQRVRQSNGFSNSKKERDWKNPHMYSDTDGEYTRAYVSADDGDVPGLSIFTRTGRIFVSLRALTRSPGSAIVATLTLALGIGANTAMFSLLDQIVLRLLPVKEPERLAMVTERGDFYGDSYGGNTLSWPMFEDLRDNNQVFSGMFCRFRNTRLWRSFLSSAVPMVSTISVFDFPASTRPLVASDTQVC